MPAANQDCASTGFPYKSFHPRCSLYSAVSVPDRSDTTFCSVCKFGPLPHILCLAYMPDTASTTTAAAAAAVAISALPVQSATRLCPHCRDMNDAGRICVLYWNFACWVIAKNMRTHFPAKRMNVHALFLPPDFPLAGDQTWKVLNPCTNECRADSTPNIVPSVHVISEHAHKALSQTKQNGNLSNLSFRATCLPKLESGFSRISISNPPILPTYQLSAYIHTPSAEICAKSNLPNLSDHTPSEWLETLISHTPIQPSLRGVTCLAQCNLPPSQGPAL